MITFALFGFGGFLAIILTVLLLTWLKVERNLRIEMRQTSQALRDDLTRSLFEFTNTLTHQFDNFKNTVAGISELQGRQLETIRQSVENKLKDIQTDNNKKLDEMRVTVDEKLHATLEKRLGMSFQLVSERLEQVHKGLGEMQSLATGVGDLKRVLTNVKTRGTWGETQLAALLEDILTPEQYEYNIPTRPGSNARVEYAVKFPGRQRDEGPLWLPIDAKFPQEDYQRLLDAQEAADVGAMETAIKQLEIRMKTEAKAIREKYIEPPHTTDFAILFLPTESLYAEVLRRPGLRETIQRDYRVIVTGPTTLGALLNSLQMGFRTLAIERRSSEVWQLLSAVKTEFVKFGDILDKTQKKLQEASNTIETAAQKSRTISRRLDKVETLPELTPTSEVVLELESS
jgi:DNA recombination protein RmuC